MKSLFNRNLFALAQTDAALAEALNELPESCCQANDDSLSIDWRGRQTHLYFGNRQAAAKTLLASAELNLPPHLLVFYGAGPIAHIQALLTQCGQFAQGILLIESCLPLLRQVLCEIDLVPYINARKFTCITTLDRARLLDILYRERLYLYTGSQLAVIASESLELDRNLHIGFAALLKETVDLISQYQGFLEDNLIGLRHTLANRVLVNSLPNAAGLAGLASDIPGVLIATGPSLAQHFEFLRVMQHKAILVCCDSALSIVVDQGIIPHIVVSVERAEQVRHYYETFDADKHGTIMVGLPLLHPNAFFNFKGKKSVIFPKTNLVEWLWPKETSIYECGPSSANFAYSLLALLQVKTIYLVGQDLCFEENSGKTHAPGIRFHAERMLHDQAKENLCEAVSNSGVAVLTQRKWAQFRDILEYQIRKHRIRTINVLYKNWGLKIAGTEAVEAERLSLAALPRCGISLAKLFAACRPTSQDSSALLAAQDLHIAQLRSQLAALRNQIPETLSSLDNGSTLEQLAGLRKYRDELEKELKGSLLLQIYKPDSELCLARYYELDFGDQDKDPERIKHKRANLNAWFAGLLNAATKIEGIIGNG